MENSTLNFDFGYTSESTSTVLQGDFHSAVQRIERGDMLQRVWFLEVIQRLHNAQKVGRGPSILWQGVSNFCEKHEKTHAQKRVKTSERYVAGKGGGGQFICYEVLHRGRGFAIFRIKYNYLYTVDFVCFHGASYIRSSTLTLEAFFPWVHVFMRSPVEYFNIYKELSSLLRC